MSSRTSSSASGFNIAEGPEVETVYYNFDALNHAPTHPSRLMTDTFYVEPTPDIFDPTRCRRASTPRGCRSCAILLHRRARRTYRPDNDATHTPQFHQIEGLAVDHPTSRSSGDAARFTRARFGADREVGAPALFPITEPSVEVDVSCFNCVDGVTADG